MAKKAHKKAYDVIDTLEKVICPRQVAEHWFYHPSYIEQLVNQGKLSYMKSGKNVILDLEEVVELLGQPKKPLTYRVRLRIF